MMENRSRPPGVTANDWPMATPESTGFAGATLRSMISRFEQWTKANVHAVLIARRGVLVFEHYFSGIDEHCGQSTGEIAFDPEIMHDQRSITKSVVALLLGIAIDQGWVKGVDESVLSFFPEYADIQSREKRRITLRHLLTMSSGLEWHELDTPYSSELNSENLADNALDPLRYVLEQKVVAEPGRVWNYSSGSTELLGAVLEKSIGEPLDRLARNLLFDALCIVDVEWCMRPQGHPSAAYGLRMRPRDVAKIGQLVLQGGEWNSTQLVSASWIAVATTQQINAPSFGSYGYQFWIERTLIGDRPVDWAIGVGFGGQRLWISRALDLVLVVNAGLYNSDELMILVPTAILNEYVLKALQPHT
jgi:CubicO group peptidase (beta-lactamase class C family)